MPKIYQHISALEVSILLNVCSVKTVLCSVQFQELLNKQENNIDIIGKSKECLTQSWRGTW